MSPLEATLLVFVLGTAALVAVLRDVVGAVVAFAAFSLGLALLWVLLAAPDVALAEAAVGTGVMSVLLLLTIVKTTSGPPGELDHEDGQFRRVNGRALAVLLILGVPLLMSVRALPAFGSPATPSVRRLYPDGRLTPYGYYVEQTLETVGFSNAVVAILVVYRHLDTAGELVVAFAAVVGVLLVLGQEDIR